MTFLRRAAIGLALIYPVLLLVLSAWQYVAPRREGWLALSEVLAPYLFVPALLAAPFALLRGAAPLRLALAACSLIALLRFSPELRTPTPEHTPDRPYVEVVSWNVGLCCSAQSQAARVRSLLASTEATIVALPEAGWRWIDYDAEIAAKFPTRLWNYDPLSTDPLLLSRYPLLEHGIADDSKIADGSTRLVWARLDVEGRPLLVVAAHPLPPDPLIPDCTLEHCFKTSARDASIARVRAIVDPALARGEVVLVLGDFNLTEREPAYADLTRGLQDAQRVAGSGWGATWAPKQAGGSDRPLLRIDYQLAGPGLRPVVFGVDCAPRGSDHCLLRGKYVFTR
jgi:vancomycin resistance protein VanJ